MEKEKFIKQRIEIDKVTRKYFDKNYIVIECDCGKSYCNGWRCLTKSDINDENLFNYIKNLENEKQQLISFLDDRINLCDKDIKEFDKNRNVYFRIIEDTKMCKKTYQDVLNFINKGFKK